MSKPTFLAPLIGKSVGQCELVYAERGSVLAREVEPAFDSKTRKKGLLGRESIPPRLRDGHRAVQRGPHVLDARSDRPDLREEGRDDHEDVPRRQTMAHGRLAGRLRGDRSGRGVHRSPRDRAGRSRRIARDGPRRWLPGSRVPRRTRACTRSRASLPADVTLRTGTRRLPMSSPAGLRLPGSRAWRLCRNCAKRCSSAGPTMTCESRN